MKTINLELSKRLAPCLENVETEFWYCDTRKSWKEYNCYRSNQYAEMEFIPFRDLDEEDIECERIDFDSNGPYPNEWYNKSDPIKTLTLEEAIEFLPKEIKNGDYWLRIEPSYNCKMWEVSYSQCEPCGYYDIFEDKDLLICIEKMLEYLLDNDLLWKK